MASNKYKRLRKHQKSVLKDRKGKDIPKEVSSLQSDKQNHETPKSFVEGTCAWMKGIFKNGINTFSNPRYSSSEKSESKTIVPE
jgi:hypothetical protein